MDATIVTLLTIAVILLSLVIIALLAAVTIVIVKVNHIAKSVDQITGNLASATDWLSPVKVFSEVTKAIQHIRK